MINGKDFPRIEINLDSNVTTIDGSVGCVTTYEYNIEDVILYKSIFTGRQTQKVKGYYNKFTIDFKLVDTTLYNKLVQLTDEGCSITFYPHKDKLDISYVVYLSKYKPYYQNNLYSVDAFLIELTTRDYISN